MTPNRTRTSHQLVEGLAFIIDPRTRRNKSWFGGCNHDSRDLRQSSADKIDLLKLDIEGAELELFSCGSDVWLGHVRLLVLELHDRFRPGCAQALYTAANGRPFTQEIRGETLFIRFRESCTSPPLKKNCEPVAQ